MEKIKSIFILTCLLLAVPCAGEPIIVDANTANPSANFHNIKDAISSPTTTDGDIIVVNPGVYNDVNNRNLDFLGKAITLMSTNPNDPDIVAATIIDCQELGCGFLFLSGEDTNSIVDGFTITNGKANLGGGMYCEGSSPMVKNCVFSGNSAIYVGGGMYCLQSSPTVKNCVFTTNICKYGGGGIYNFTNSCPNVSNCTFINNSAYTTTGVCSGGGIHNRDNSSPTITNCKFIGNTAKQDGGGIYNQKSSHPNIINCTFINNSGRAGGGIYNYSSNPKIVNCTFSKNSTNLFNPGGAISNQSSSPNILNCIIWDNQGTSPSEIYPMTLTTVSYSDVNEGYSGEGNINFNPLFVDPNAGDYHLQPSSPCINAGDPCGVYVGQTDIDGEPRVFGSCVDMGSDEAWPDVEVAPSELEYDFGDVNIGTSDMTFVTIYNSGSANLTVSAISFTPDSNSDFSITSGPNLPAAIEPDGFVYVGITYSPSVEGYAAAILEIISDDPDEDLVQINLGGFGVQTELPPEGQIAEILAFFDASVADGGLLGSGPGKSAQGRLGALRNMIEASGDLIEDGLLEEACEQLLDAYNRIDGQPRPPEFAQGTAAPTLAGMIEGLRMSLECQ